MQLRKGAIAWSHCTHDILTREQLRCSLGITNPDRIIEQSEANSIYLIGLNILGKNIKGVSFPIFLLLSDFYKTFSQFIVPFDDGFVSRKDMLNRLMDTSLPSRLNIKNVNMIFDVLEQEEINFPGFVLACLWNMRFNQ